MAKKKEVEEVGVAPDATGHAVVQGETETTAKGDMVVKYRDHKGEETSRVFSKDVHGKDFAKLADEFKETNASRIIA